MASTKTLLEWERDLTKANTLVIELPRWQQVSPILRVGVPANLRTSDRRPLIVRERESAATAQSRESDDAVPAKTPVWLALPVQIIAICMFGALALCAIPVMVGFGILTLIAEGSGRLLTWLKDGSW